MSGAVLLTGATGFVGAEVLDRLLDGGEREVLALVRGRDAVEAEDRLDAALRRLHGELPPGRERVRALPADLTAPGLGLRGMDRRRIAAAASDVVHCAASVSFDLSWPDAQAINVEGTRRVVELADELPRLRRLVHVSTAYVAGTRPGRVGEHELDAGQGFRNTYERSKHAAERLLDASGLPAVVARPSIVMGERTSGWTPTFNVLYWPLRAFGARLLDRMPGRPDGLVDAVPVDYVADGIVAALQAQEPPRRLHLVAGDGAATVDEVVAVGAETFDIPHPPYLAPGEQLRMGSGNALLPYFAVRTVFDDRQARALLEPQGIRAPRTVDLLGILLDYARAARWGRAGVSRAEARARVAVPA